MPSASLFLCTCMCLLCNYPQLCGLFSPRGTLGPLMGQAGSAGTLKSSGAVLSHRWLGAGGQIAQPNHLWMRTNPSPFYPSPEPTPCPIALLRPAHQQTLNYTCASWDHHPREFLLSLSQTTSGGTPTQARLSTPRITSSTCTEIYTARSHLLLAGSPQQPQETGNGISHSILQMEKLRLEEE